VNQLKNN